MQAVSIDPIIKIHHVVQIIEQKMALSPKGGQIVIPMNSALEEPLLTGDMRAILAKLEQDEGVITFHHQPGERYVERNGINARRGAYSAYILTPKNKFPAYAQKIKAQMEAIQKPESTQPNAAASILKNDLGSQNQKITSIEKTPSQVDPMATAISLRFDDLNRYILLNETFLIAQPAYDSENYRFFEYVWKNPNRTISLEELNRSLEEPLKKSLAKILENLNFRGPLKDAFFQVSKTSICFIPSRSIDELTQAGLYPLRLFTTRKAN